MSRFPAAPSLALAIAFAAPCPAMAGPASLPPTEQVRPIVIGQSFALPSKVLGDIRRVNVYLPESYGDAARAFPVVVLLDGGEKEDFHHVTGLAQINAAYGQGQEVIVVGVEGVDRRHDLTSPSSVAADLKVAPTSGGAAAYRKFLVEELKPWVAARYRTNGRTALMGESLAGLFTLETLLKAPESFDDYVIVSPSLWWNGGALVGEAGADLRQGALNGRRAWIAFDDPSPPADVAARERAAQDRLAAAFASGAPAGLWWKVTRPGEGHGGIYHPALMAAFREFYGRPKAAPNP
jgi:predicted alpha/beta superfamily hydrolase